MNKVWDVVPPKKNLTEEQKMALWLRKQRLKPKGQVELEHGSEALKGPAKFYEGPMTNEKRTT